MSVDTAAILWRSWLALVRVGDTTFAEVRELAGLLPRHDLLARARWFAARLHVLSRVFSDCVARANIAKAILDELSLMIAHWQDWKLWCEQECGIVFSFLRSVASSIPESPSQFPCLLDDDELTKCHARILQVATVGKDDASRLQSAWDQMLTLASASHAFYGHIDTKTLPKKQNAIIVALCADAASVQGAVMSCFRFYQIPVRFLFEDAGPVANVDLLVFTNSTRDLKAAQNSSCPRRLFVRSRSFGEIPCDQDLPIFTVAWNLDHLTQVEEKKKDSDRVHWVPKGVISWFQRKNVPDWRAMHCFQQRTHAQNRLPEVNRHLFCVDISVPSSSASKNVQPETAQLDQLGQVYKLQEVAASDRPDDCVAALRSARFALFRPNQSDFDLTSLMNAWLSGCIVLVYGPIPPALQHVVNSDAILAFQSEQEVARIDANPVRRQQLSQVPCFASTFMSNAFGTNDVPIPSWVVHTMSQLEFT